MKRNITLEQAYNLIGQCSAVIIDEDHLVYPSIDDLNGEPENEWCYLSWDDGYNEYCVKFIEAEQEIMYDGSSIYMKDNKDTDTKITLLVPNGQSI